LDAAQRAELPPAISFAPASAVVPADANAEAATVAAPIEAPAPKLPILAFCSVEPTIPASMGGSLLTKESKTTDATSNTQRLFESGVPFARLCNTDQGMTYLLQPKMSC